MCTNRIATQGTALALAAIAVLPAFGGQGRPLAPARSAHAEPHKMKLGNEPARARS